MASVGNKKTVDVVGALAIIDEAGIASSPTAVMPAEDPNVNTSTTIGHLLPHNP
jgi:hypothetical protein